MKNNARKKLVILGGGTAGCVKAAALARHLSPDLYELTLVESLHIGSIGVGESALPSFTAFLSTLGLDEQDIIQSTGASIKLGETGCIESLELNNHETVQGDFFIDCSGLRGMLINEAMTGCSGNRVGCHSSPVWE